MRPLHLVRAIAPTRCPLERPEAKEAQQEPKWKTRGCEATKEILDSLCMRVTPLHLVRAIAPTRCPLERLLELEDTEQCLEREDSGLDLAIRELENVDVRLEPEDTGLEPEGSGQHAMGAPPH